MWQDELQRTIDSWIGTPYVAGARMRRRGVDCLNFVDAVMQELHGYRLPALGRVSPDVVFHDRRATVAHYRGLASRYPHSLLRAPTMPEPGDVLVYAHDGVPGHALIAGREPMVLWHADMGVGVGRTGWGDVESSVVRLWRLTEKETWLCAASRRSRYA